jgi:hypothetical protein
MLALTCVPCTKSVIQQEAPGVMYRGREGCQVFSTMVNAETHTCVGFHMHSKHVVSGQTAGQGKYWGRPSQAHLPAYPPQALRNIIQVQLCSLA